MYVTIKESASKRKAHSDEDVVIIKPMNNELMNCLDDLKCEMARHNQKPHSTKCALRKYLYRIHLELNGVCCPFALFHFCVSVSFVVLKANGL